MPSYRSCFSISVIPSFFASSSLSLALSRLFFLSFFLFFFFCSCCCSCYSFWPFFVLLLAVVVASCLLRTWLSFFVTLSTLCFELCCPVVNFSFTSSPSLTSSPWRSSFSFYISLLLFSYSLAFCSSFMLLASCFCYECWFSCDLLAWCYRISFADSEHF